MGDEKNADFFCWDTFIYKLFPYIYSRYIHDLLQADDVVDQRGETDLYQADNCRSKNEFIEKAVNCYADMLAAGESTTLPRAVQSAIDSRLKLFEDRIASLLYKQAVEMDMAMSILLQSLNVSEEVLRQERAKSIAAVKRTNGQLRMEQKLRELESEAWQG